MAQCLHLEADGRRCQNQTQEEAPFCRWHDPETTRLPFLTGNSLRRWVYRLVALLLLAIFLVPLVVQGWRILRALIR